MNEIKFVPVSASPGSCEVVAYNVVLVLPNFGGQRCIKTYGNMFPVSEMTSFAILVPWIYTINKYCIVTYQFTI